MRKLFLPPAIVLIATIATAQTRLGVFAGIANYQGDLVHSVFASPKAAVGISAAFTVSPRLSIRTGLTFAKVAGADSLSSEYYRGRNLSFQSPVTELSLMAEYNLFNLDNIKWTPYAFAGISGYHFNPFTYDGVGRKIYLQPLGTEGQGISGYNAKLYALNGFAIPFGGGIKVMLSDKIQLGFETGLRKLFTDYLDDVSGNFADPQDLLQARGQQAVDLAFRGDEVAGSTQAYPPKGETRGSPRRKDYFYFTGLHLTFEIGDGLFSGRGKKGYGCPANVF